jgi:homoserine kinase
VGGRERAPRHGLGAEENTVRVRVPATSANLGPGFDALGLALTLYDEVEARVTAGGVHIEITGEGEDLTDAGEKHLVVRAMRDAFDAFGAVQPPGLALRCVNRIPHGRGLGSSAAAIVSGILAAAALAGIGQDTYDALTLATEIEGHPDNVAACLAGGLTIAWTTPDGPKMTRLEPDPAITPIVCIAPPDVAVRTEVARQALPPVVPHKDAAANAARAALLIAALTRPQSATPPPQPTMPPPQHVPRTISRGPTLSGDAVGAIGTPEPPPVGTAGTAGPPPDGTIGTLPHRGAAEPDLFDATEDWLHQAYRAEAMPDTYALVQTLRREGFPAVVSGAGPSVLILAGPDLAPCLDSLGSIVRETGKAWHISPLDVERQGARLLRPDARRVSWDRLPPLSATRIAAKECRGPTWC